MKRMSSAENRVNVARASMAAATVSLQTSLRPPAPSPRPTAFPRTRVALCSSGSYEIPTARQHDAKLSWSANAHPPTAPSARRSQSSASSASSPYCPSWGSRRAAPVSRADAMSSSSFGSSLSRRCAQSRADAMRNARYLNASLHSCHGEATRQETSSGAASRVRGAIASPSLGTASASPRSKAPPLRLCTHRAAPHWTMGARARTHSPSTSLQPAAPTSAQPSPPQRTNSSVARSRWISPCTSLATPGLGSATDSCSEQASTSARPPCCIVMSNRPAVCWKRVGTGREAVTCRLRPGAAGELRAKRRPLADDHPYAPKLKSIRIVSRRKKEARNVTTVRIPCTPSFVRLCRSITNALRAWILTRRGHFVASVSKG
mmetsp:Transcript_18855/g.38388  ORF Transcript_18855/g.38388 Transcript_18855/m.38388 type:complete len:376 (-) Transcript_18855:185-1312(-)